MHRPCEPMEPRCCGVQLSRTLELVGSHSSPGLGLESMGWQRTLVWGVVLSCVEVLGYS